MALPWVPNSEYRISISPDDIVKHIGSLSRGKAVGVDMLNDGWIKDAIMANPELRFKLAFQMERWINGDE